MTTNERSESATYKIGAVSKMTGIAPDTLRIWERRYDVVTPERTPAGGRLYNQEQISRLSMVKNLVDAGDSISSVAGLKLEELQERLTRNRQTQANISAYYNNQVCHLAIFGESLSFKLENTLADIDSMEVIANSSDATEFETVIKSHKPDVLLVEIPTLHEESANLVLRWLQQSNAMHVILVYRFGNTESFRRLPKSRCSLIQAPISPVTIQRLCESLMGIASQMEMNEKQALPHAGEMASPRKYDDETLARIAMASTTITCECPRHLTELITSLSAFERYSTECESRSPEDAALHTYLSLTTSRARVLIESALEKVIETENIEI